MLRWPPEPVVWFMSESRAVSNEHEGYKQTLLIISSSFWMAVGLKGLYNAIFYSLYNPLRPIGSPVTHENWPMNWPNFTVSPALLGWPARNRHTAACIHRFSHTLRWPPEPVVWFMFESIISSSFWMAVGLKGLMMQESNLQPAPSQVHIDSQEPATYCHFFCGIFLIKQTLD